MPSCVAACADSTENSSRSTPIRANASYTRPGPLPFVMTVTRSPFTLACNASSSNRSHSVGSPPENTTCSAVVWLISHSNSRNAFPNDPLAGGASPSRFHQL